MAASQNDLFKKSGASTVTTLAAPGKSLGATTINVGSTTNYPTDTGIVIAIRQVDTSGELVPGTYTTWNATVTSATSLAISSTPRYGSDQVYPASSTTQVYIPISSAAQEDLINGLLVSHDQDGTLKAGAVDNAAALANDVVTTAKILDSNVTTAKIADSNVTTAKIANGAVTFAKTSGLGWEELGTATANATTSSLSVSFTARKNLMIIVTAENITTASQTHDITFNSDTTTNYARNQTRLNGGTVTALTTNVANAGTLLYTGTGQIGEAVLNVGNADSPTKTKSISGNFCTSVDSRNGFSNWLNNTTAITSVQLTSSVANGIAAGSTLIVLGRNS